MEKDKYVEWEHVKELIKLFAVRDCFKDWDKNYEKYNKDVKDKITWLEKNTKTFSE